MTELTMFSVKYAALIFLSAIMVWRFWGKIEGVLLLTALGFFGYNQCSRIEVPSIINNTSVQTRKEEIIALSQMTIDEAAGQMYNEGKWPGKSEGDALIYPEDMKKDYYKFFQSNPGKFIIAFSDGKEYESFFSSIDSLIVEGNKAVECPKGKAYQLTNECFVCKTGFRIQHERFILSVSRNLNFSTPNPTSSPKRKQKSPVQPSRTPKKIDPYDILRQKKDSTKSEREYIG